jgi:hypothetical protein
VVNSSYDKFGLFEVGHVPGFANGLESGVGEAGRWCSAEYGSSISDSAPSARAT